MNIVKIRIIQLPLVVASHAWGQGREEDLLAFGDLFAFGHALDEPGDKLDHRLAMAPWDAVDAQVGASKFAHAAGMNPEAFRAFGADQQGLIEGGGEVGFKEGALEFTWGPPFEPEGIEDGDGAMVGQVSEEPHGIAEVEQVGGVRQLAMDEEAERGAVDGLAQALGGLAKGSLEEGLLEHRPGPGLIAAVPHDLEGRGVVAQAIAVLGRSDLGGEFTEDVVEEAGFALGGLKARAGPGEGDIAHAVRFRRRSCRERVSGPG
jgi:hypothetical protein